MTDPTPITLPEGEALYQAGDLPDEGWECRGYMDETMCAPSLFVPERIVVARRKRWVPKVGDRVQQVDGRSGVVVAVDSGTGSAWVRLGCNDYPITRMLTDLSPEVDR